MTIAYFLRLKHGKHKKKQHLPLFSRALSTGRILTKGLGHTYLSTETGKNYHSQYYK